MSFPRGSNGLGATSTPGAVRSSPPGPAASMLPVADTWRGRRVLVTGVTGFVGKVWVAHVLEYLGVERIILLVRPGAGGDAKTRAMHVFNTSPALRRLRQLHGASYPEFIAKTVTVVEGDVTMPGLGLSESDAKVARTAEVVVNFAGVTEFDPDLQLGIEVNVRGAIEVARFAARSRGSRLLHVSTCFVAGHVSQTVLETIALGTTPNGTVWSYDEELLHADALSARATEEAGGDPKRAKKARASVGMDRARELGFQNTYTYTKALAEEGLRELVASREATSLRMCIVRPSIVECAESFPFPGWNEGVNTSTPLIWLLSTPFREFPCRPELRFDVIPVDYVARGTTLAATALLRKEAPVVVHLGSSDTNPFTIGRGLELTNLAIRKHYQGKHAVWTEVVRAFDALPTPSTSFRIGDPTRLHALARKARVFFENNHIADALPEALRGLREPLSSIQWKGHVMLSTADVALKRVDAMLKLFRPFIEECDCVFDASESRRLDMRVGDAERDAFSFDPAKLDWRSYWIDVQYPGVQQWCIPAMEGRSVPEDVAAYPVTRETLEAPVGPQPESGETTVPQLASPSFAPRTARTRQERA